MSRLHVAVDARLAPGSAGGVETVIVGLAQGFAELRPDDIHPMFFTYPGQARSLRQQAPGAGVAVLQRPSMASRVVRKGYAGVGRASGATRGHVPDWAVVRPDRELDRIRPDIVHYPYQANRRPSAPFVYQPHDLQHLHLPQFFTPQAIRWREAVYPTMCRAAAAVAVGNRWVKNDLVDRYGLEPEKVFVIPLAPVSVAEVDETVSSPVDVPYLLYPAVNWPHKNHRRLLQALALASRREPDMHLVLTGGMQAGHPDPVEMAAKLGLSDRVHVLGYVDAPTLAAVYREARGVVVPTLFEAASFPVWEAFQRGIPVACSDVTSLPEQTDGNAILFDPLDVEAMSDAMVRLWTDDDLRAKLVAGGRERVAAFTWRRTAQGFSALYRYVAGRTLSDDDERLLAAEDL